MRKGQSSRDGEWGWAYIGDKSECSGVFNPKDKDLNSGWINYDNPHYDIGLGEVVRDEDVNDEKWDVMKKKEDRENWWKIVY